MLRDIVGLSRRESKPKQEATRICAEVAFGAEPASALAEGLRASPLRPTACACPAPPPAARAIPSLPRRSVCDLHAATCPHRYVR